MKVALRGYITVAELARKTGKHRVLISHHCRVGKMPCVRLGRIYVIPTRAALAFIRKVEAERALQRMAQEVSDETLSP